MSDPISEFGGGVLFSDLALARRLERAEAEANARFVEARAAAFPESSAEWMEVAGAYAMFDKASSPVTQSFGLGLFGPVAESEIERIERFFQERGAPVCHEISPMGDPGLLTLLNRRGYQPVEFTSVMCRAIGAGISFEAASNGRVRTRLVREEEQNVWAKITSEGWGETPELTDFIHEIGQFQSSRRGTLIFFAELDRQPVATGVLCISDGVALLAGACTVPEARRQGAQMALLECRLRYAAEKGCDFAMISAQPPGGASQRNAERHGFRVAYTRVKWQLTQR